MYEACKALEAQGRTDFGLLLLYGEETGSYGAKSFNGMVDHSIDDSWVIVGEPTDNHMASAAKGTKSFEVKFTGKPCHSGYPENGESAIEYFNDFMNALRSIVFPKDEILGETSWNVGKLVSDNPQNILSDSLTCRVYFRTTFESDEMVCNIMKNIAGTDAKLRFGRRKVQDGSDIVAKAVAPWQKAMSVTAYGGDSPSRFEVFEGFPSKPVAFGSDAPQLSCFPHKILCGPGSILVAHKDEEHISLNDLETAAANYVRMYEIINEQ
jgi:acetylornithine deacetylase